MLESYRSTHPQLAAEFERRMEGALLQRLMAFAAKRFGEDPSPAQMALAMTD